MTGLTNRSAAEALNNLIAEYPYVGLVTTVGIDDGTGFVEVSGGSYARFPTGSGDWDSPTGTSPSVMTNNFDLAYPQAAADWGTVVGVAFYDAPTSGNIGAFEYLGNYPWMPCTISSASPGIITAKAHGISVTNSLVFTTEYGGTAPTFSQSNFTGVLVAAHITTDTLDVTNSSTQVNTSSTGSGMIRRITTQVVSSGVFVTIPAGAITISNA